MISGLKDVDREILKYVYDEELLKICSVNRKFWNEICDDNFLIRRLSKYPEIEKYRYEKETWKQFFARFVYYKSTMRKIHKFKYESGDFKKQYDLLKYSKYFTKNYLLTEAAEKGELAVIKYAVKRGTDIHWSNELALREATEKGHLEIVKFLVQSGANIHIGNDMSLRLAIQTNHSEMIHFLMNKVG